MDKLVELLGTVAKLCTGVGAQEARSVGGDAGLVEHVCRAAAVLALGKAGGGGGAAAGMCALCSVCTGACACVFVLVRTCVFSGVCVDFGVRFVFLHARLAVCTALHGLAGSPRWRCP